MEDARSSLCWVANCVSVERVVRVEEGSERDAEGRVLPRHVLSTVLAVFSWLVAVCLLDSATTPIWPGMRATR